MFLSARRCAEHMTQLWSLEVNVTVQGHGIYPKVGVCYIPPEPFESFSLNFTEIFLSVRRCAEEMTQLPRLLKVMGTFRGDGIFLPFNLVSGYV